MTRVLRLLGTIIIIGMLSSLASAQGLGSISIPIGPLSLHALYSPSPSKIKLNSSGEGQPGNAGSGEGELTWRSEGVWLGADLTVDLAPTFSVTSTASYLIPFCNYSSVFVREITNGIELMSDLDVEPQWFTADLEVTWQYSNSMSLVGGVRYDYLTATFTAGPDIAALLAPSVPLRADLNVNSIFPYIGIRNQLGRAGDRGRLIFTAKGFPFGIVSEGAPDKAYFAEIDVQYGFSPYDNVTLQLDAKWHTARALFKGLSVISSIFNPDPSQAQRSGMVDVDLAVHWQQVYLGAIVLIDFNWSNILPFTTTL